MSTHDSNPTTNQQNRTNNNTGQSDERQMTCRVRGDTVQRLDILEDLTGKSANRIINESLDLLYSVTAGAQSVREYEGRVRRARYLAQIDIEDLTDVDVDDADVDVDDVDVDVDVDGEGTGLVVDDEDDGPGLVVDDLQDDPARLNDLDYADVPEDGLPSDLDFSVLKQGMSNRGPAIYGRLLDESVSGLLTDRDVEQVLYDVSDVTQKTRQSYLESLERRDILVRMPWMDDSRMRSDDITQSVRRSAAEAVGELSNQDTRTFSARWTSDAPECLPGLLARRWDDWSGSDIDADFIVAGSDCSDELLFAVQDALMQSLRLSDSTSWTDERCNDVCLESDEDRDLIPPASERAAWIAFAKEMAREMLQSDWVDVDDFGRLMSAMLDVEEIATNQSDCSDEHAKSVVEMFDKVVSTTDVSLSPCIPSSGSLSDSDVSDGDVEDALDALGLEEMPDSIDDLDAVYTSVVKEVHPDVGGSADEFSRVQDAYDVIAGKLSKL